MNFQMRLKTIEHGLFVCLKKTLMCFFQLLRIISQLKSNESALTNFGQVFLQP